MSDVVPTFTVEFLFFVRNKKPYSACQYQVNAMGKIAGLCIFKYIIDAGCPLSANVFPYRMQVAASCQAELFTSCSLQHILYLPDMRFKFDNPTDSERKHL